MYLWIDEWVMFLLRSLTLCWLIWFSSNPCINLFPFGIRGFAILWKEGYETHIKGICLFNDICNSICHFSQSLWLMSVDRWNWLIWQYLFICIRTSILSNLSIFMLMLSRLFDLLECLFKRWIFLMFVERWVIFLPFGWASIVALLNLQSKHLLLQ